MSGAAAPGAPWYREGLRFHCTACGKCCTGVPGHVWVTEEEVGRMARFKGQSLARFVNQHVKRMGSRLTLIERQNGDCVLLKDGKCSVYAVKPTPCSTFPFWDAALASKEIWKQTAERCEGIGQGALYSLQEIETIKAGDPRPLLEKHRHEALAAAAAPVPPAPLKPVEPAPVEAVPVGSEDGDAPEALPPSPAAWDAAFRDLEALYADLEKDLPRFRFTCVASGDCCDFEAYGHRLYASTLEAEWFFRNSPSPRVNSNERHCPAWGKDRLCKARTGRMLGCRTYFCGPYPAGIPEDIHEPYHKRIQALHALHGIPYRYRDITAWSAERRPVPEATA